MALMPLYTTAAAEAATAAADVTPDEYSQVPACIYVSEETRRLASISRRLIERHFERPESGSANEGTANSSNHVSKCLAAMLPTLCDSLRDGCSVGAILAALAVADLVASSDCAPCPDLMHAHIEALCDAAQRADAAVLTKCLSMAQAWLTLDVPACCRRLAAVAPQSADNLCTCFAPASSAASGGNKGGKDGKAAKDGKEAVEATQTMDET